MMQIMKSVNEEESINWADVLIAVTAKDEIAFGRFFDHFAPKIKAFSHRKQPGADLQAEDLVQEVMIKVWDKAHTFNPQLAGVSTWLFTMARNCQIDQFRRDKSYLFQSLDADDLWYEHEAQPDPFHAFHQLRVDSSVQESLKQLPREQIEVLNRIYMQGRTQQETALEMGLPLGTVKSRVRLALKKLEQTMRS